MCMYRYICEHAHFWDKQKGEERWTPGWRLAVGRLPVVTPFPAARPSPALQDQSLHPPSPRCRRSTNNTDTCTLRSATLGSTLPRRPHFHRVDAYLLAETTPPRKLRARRPPSRVRGCCRLRASSGSRHCSLRVLQLVISEHAASPHAPCAGRCCCGPMCPRPALLHDVPAVDKRVIDVVNTAFTSAPARPAGRA